MLEGVPADAGRHPQPHVVDLGALQLLRRQVAAVVRHPLRPVRIAVVQIKYTGSIMVCFAFFWLLGVSPSLEGFMFAPEE